MRTLTSSLPSPWNSTVIVPAVVLATFVFTSCIRSSPIMVIGKSATAILFQRSAFNSAIRAVFWNRVAEQHVHVVESWTASSDFAGASRNNSPDGGGCEGGRARAHVRPALSGHQTSAASSACRDAGGGGHASPL